MFFKNHLIALFAKFLWVGLILGLFYLICSAVIKLSKRNIYVSNIIGFCYWLLFGGAYAFFCANFYFHSFCWFGLLGMFLGFGLVKISIDFFFTKFARLVYNKLAKLKKRKFKNEQLQAN